MSARSGHRAKALADLAYHSVLDFDIFDGTAKQG
jgi:hypothetical protein